MSLERHFSRICTSLRIPWAYSLTSTASLGLSKRADAPNAAMSHQSRQMTPFLTVRLRKARSILVCLVGQAVAASQRQAGHQLLKGLFGASGRESRRVIGRGIKLVTASS